MKWRDRSGGVILILVFSLLDRPLYLDLLSLIEDFAAQWRFELRRRHRLSGRRKIEDPQTSADVADVDSPVRLGVDAPRSLETVVTEDRAAIPGLEEGHFAHIGGVRDVDYSQASFVIRDIGIFAHDHRVVNYTVGTV